MKLCPLLFNADSVSAECIGENCIAYEHGECRYFNTVVDEKESAEYSQGQFECAKELLESMRSNL